MRITPEEGRRATIGRGDRRGVMACDSSRSCRQSGKLVVDYRSAFRNAGAANWRFAFAHLSSAFDAAAMPVTERPFDTRRIQ
ncbi:hypothetical protein [Burkholderia sp. 22313]|uniref:hypothetical protein n=1 Tax=Burkholderia sp. 22313 TaxID=3453908 RepID=UPI002CD6326F|nr:hypothetical protein [Burkholderia sp.]